MFTVSREIRGKFVGGSTCIERLNRLTRSFSVTKCSEFEVRQFRMTYLSWGWTKHFEIRSVDNDHFSR